MSLLALGCGAFALLAFLARREARRSFVRSLDALPTGARIVVLGCRTHMADGRPNRLLEARIAAGAAAYHALARRAPTQPPRLLATGYEPLGEIGAMQAGLSSAGVPEARIELDPDAARTIDSIQFLARQAPPSATADGRDLVFVSQPFHLPRVLWLARAHGLSALGLPARGTPARLQGRVREGLAWLRAFADVGRRRLTR